LLQMSTLDLQQEIQQALESNMMLEISEEENTAIHVADTVPEKKTENSDSHTSEGSQTDIPEELPIDTSWMIFMRVLWNQGITPLRLLSLRPNALKPQHYWIICYGNWRYPGFQSVIMP